MKVTLRNLAMDEMRRKLEPLLQHRNRIGYIAARNYRALSDVLTEYTAFRNGLIEKYGEQDTDENGRELSTVSIRVDSDGFRKFSEEMEPFNAMMHEVELMYADYEEVIGVLTGEEILAIDWMLKE